MREKIIKMLQQVNIPSQFSEDTLNDYVDALKEINSGLEWSWDGGISKFVLLFANYDKVIKIPYLGKYDYDAYEDAIAQDVGADHTLEEFFYEFTGPENYDNIERGWDYCELETMFYEIAETKGLAQYFAKEELCGWIKGHPIYLQTRVTPLESVCSRTIGEREAATEKRCQELHIHCLDTQWVSDFFDEYGEEEYLRLCAFLTEYDITDLHIGNLGYLNNKPILLDYSSYMN